MQKTLVICNCCNVRTNCEHIDYHALLSVSCCLPRRTDGWLNLRCRAEMAWSAVNGLAYLHEMGVVHFDLKPDNLLLDGKMHDYMGNVPSLKVADFGLSKHKWGKEFVSGVRDLR